MDQLADGNSYAELNPAIGIHLIDFDYFKDERGTHRFVVHDADTNQTHPHLDYTSL